MNSFSGATINRLGDFTTPILEEDRPDIVIIHVGSNDITHNTINNIYAKGISKRIIDIGKKCLLYGVTEVIISSIFIKRQFKLTRIIRQVNDHLRDESRRNKFLFEARLIFLSLRKLTFPTSQFLIEGYSEPYRFDRSRNGGGVLIYVREDIPSKPLTGHKLPHDIE